MACDVPDMIQAHIYYFGQWEPNLTAFLTRRLRPGDGFVDVGANIGYFALLAAALVGDHGAVVAVEASPRIHRALLDNIRRNRRANIRALNVAASDRHGSVDLYRGTPGNQGTASLLPAPGREKEATVAAVPFDELLHDADVATARVIKIDVEGAEAPIVRRILARIGDFRPDLEIVVELAAAPASADADSAARIIERFRAAGFFGYRLTNAFSVARYLDRAPAVPPRRLEGPIVGREDVVFSRQDAAFV
jgi:FkbM family methyltransferase